MTRETIIGNIIAAGLIVAALALRRSSSPEKRCRPMNDEPDRRELIALGMRMRVRDSRDPILAAKDVEAQRRRDAPAAREAARQLLRRQGRQTEDDR